MPRAGRCAPFQYERQGDTVTALMGPPERSSTILPVEEVSGGPEKAHVPETGSSDGSASSVSAPARTKMHKARIAEVRDAASLDETIEMVRQLPVRAPTRIRALKGADLVNSWLTYTNKNRHPQGKSCPACKAELMSVGITSIVYTFEVCRCARAPYSHIFEQLWHRECFWEKRLP